MGSEHWRTTLPHHSRNRFFFAKTLLLCKDFYPCCFFTNSNKKIILYFKWVFIKAQYENHLPPIQKLTCFCSFPIISPHLPKFFALLALQMVWSYGHSIPWHRSPFFVSTLIGPSLLRVLTWRHLHLVTSVRWKVQPAVHLEVDSGREDVWNTFFGGKEK